MRPTPVGTGQIRILVGLAQIDHDQYWMHHQPVNRLTNLAEQLPC
jgi:hypothetical protein